MFGAKPIWIKRGHWGKLAYRSFAGKPMLKDDIRSHQHDAANLGSRLLEITARYRDQSRGGNSKL